MTFSRMGGLVEDAALLLLIAFALPLIILLLGTPIAIAARLFLELARRF